MILARLHNNAQRSTLNVQRSTLELPHFRTSELPRSGMTMIELVAALALFVLILGSLLTIMNTATSLWSSSRSQQKEQTAGQNILDLLADDLQHAVTDNGVPSNGATFVNATFILDSSTNQPPGGVQVVLQFARYAAPRTRTPPPSGIPLSLDAVFYTFVGNALFRHAIPLAAEFDDAKPLGDLLNEQRSKVSNTSLHTQILTYMRDPTTQPSADWSYALLAERIDLLSLPATLPEAYARKPESRQLSPARMTGTGILLPPEYDYLETDVLPDHIDVALRLHSEEDWATLRRLEGNSSAEAALQRQHLGQFFSKRITFPAQGGSRLP